MRNEREGYAVASQGTTFRTPSSTIFVIVKGVEIYFESTVIELFFGTSRV